MVALGSLFVHGLLGPQFQSHLHSACAIEHLGLSSGYLSRVRLRPGHRDEASLSYPLNAQGQPGPGGYGDTSYIWLCGPQLPEGGKEPDERSRAVVQAAEVLHLAPERNLKEVRALGLHSPRPGRRKLERLRQRATAQSPGLHGASRAKVLEDLQILSVSWSLDVSCK